MKGFLYTLIESLELFKKKNNKELLIFKGHIGRLV